MLRELMARDDFPLIAAGFSVVLVVAGYLVTRMSVPKKKCAVFLEGATSGRKKATLIDKINISHDTRRFRFALPDKDMILGLPIGKHFTLYAPNAQGVKQGEWNGRKDVEEREEIERKYTPTSSDDDKGFFDLVVKVYRPNERFCDGGKMSQYLDRLVVGKDAIELRGPFGGIEYKGDGIFENMRKPLSKKTHVGMMAGGTGITPMLQIINAILKNPADPTKLSLLFANQTEEDILLFDELKALEAKNAGRFKVWYTLDRPSAGWKYSEGFITAEMISKHLPPPSDTTLILMCGPPPMVQFACQKNLDLLGYPKTAQLVF